MNIVTLSSDFGSYDASVTVVKSKLYHALPNIQIIDINHRMLGYPLEQYGYIYYSTIYNIHFSCIHLILNQFNYSSSELLICKINNQYIILPDNGLMTFLHSIDYSATVYKYESPSPILNWNQLIDRAIEIIQKLMQGMEPSQFASSDHMYIQTLPFNNNLTLTNQTIICRVIHIDEFGNLVTNLKKDDFDKIHQNRKFNMRIFNMNSKMSENSKIEITRISKDYQDTKTNASNIGALFNSSDFLEIFMRQSNLAQLLSIVMNYNIKIDFYD
jgi:hypothetical protein